MKVLDKVTFVQLTKLADLWTDDARWQANLRNTGVQDGYTLADETEVEGDPIQDFALSEMQAVTDVKVYNFIGDGETGGDERFFERDEQVYLHTATNTLWLMWYEAMYDI